MSEVLGLFFKCAVLIEPASGGLVSLSPQCFQHAFGAFNLLHDGGLGLAPFWQVGNVADEELRDVLLGENGLQ